LIHTVKSFSVINEAEVDFFGIPLLFSWKKSYDKPRQRIQSRQLY